MTSSLFHVGTDGSFSEMRAESYDNENHIQRLLAEYPAVLGAEHYRGLEPRRWALVAREMAVPDGDLAERRWSLDHLYVDQDAIPTLVDVKLNRDARSRREVVGQMFDYAANGPSYWSIETLRRSFADTHRHRHPGPDGALRGMLGEELDTVAYWDKVEANLRAGRIRMIFLVDQMPPELLRIVEFLARQLKDAEVYAVEVRQHVGSTGMVLATNVLGQSQNDEGKMVRARDALDEGQWFSRFEEIHGPAAKATAAAIAQWAGDQGLESFVTMAKSPSLGFKLMEEGKSRYPFFVTGNGKLSTSLSYLANSPTFG